MKLKFYVDAKDIGDAKANLACRQLGQMEKDVIFAVGPDKLNDLAAEEHKGLVSSLRQVVRQQFTTEKPEPSAAEQK